ncbi:MAG: hypothetical protein AB1Z98_31305 [Nannocystaceae bacterium]
MTMRFNKLAWFATAALVAGCGDDGTNDEGAGSGGATAGATAATTEADDPTGNGMTTAPGGTGTSGTPPTGTTAADGTDTDAPDPTGSGINLDLGGIPDAPNFCNQGKGEIEGGFIWIANSTQSTISKIDTATMIEQGRYLTRQDQNGSPSRTSVSLSGNVVVANRNGGITKFYSNVDNCVDSNGNGVIDTSGDATWLPWGDDECMAWHTPMNYASQRPVAWTQGEWDQAACANINEKVWTSGANGNAIEVLLVDGETGVVEETIPIPGVNASFYGIYGAAVDTDGNFWGSQLSIGSVVNVDRQTLAVQTWPMQTSGYGMTVDASGNVWTCSGSGVSRFDTVTETWQQAVGVTGGGGCMEDANGILWLATNPLRGVNTTTLLQEYSIPIPEYVHGVSIDFEGNVWGVSLFGTNAYRVDPATGTVDTFTGLVQPYTYSDMTGFALSNVGNGGQPSG